LLSTVGANGKRKVYEPLYEEIQRQRTILGVDSDAGIDRRRLKLAAR
jgi:hypothetical protein